MRVSPASRGSLGQVVGGGVGGEVVKRRAGDAGALVAGPDDANGGRGEAEPFLDVVSQATGVVGITDHGVHRWSP